VDVNGFSLIENTTLQTNGTVAGTTIYYQGMNTTMTLTKADLENATLMEQIALGEINASDMAIAMKNTSDTHDVEVVVPTRNTMPTGRYIVLTEVIDRDTALTVSMNETSIYLGETYSPNLAKGWNLMSIPIEPENGSIYSLFTPAELNNIWVIWDYAPNDPNAYNDWDYYTPLAGYTPTLSSMDYRKGYWVYCYNSMTVQVYGNTPANDTITIDQLSSGWNLMGYPSLTPRDPATIYNDVSKVWVVWDYQPSDPNAYNGWDYYTPLSGYTPTLKTLKPDTGYWIYIK